MFGHLFKTSCQNIRKCSVIANSKNGVLQITLNRPKVKNAFTWNLYEEVATQFENANNNLKIGAVSLTGTGNFFTSGMDLNDVITMVQNSNPVEAKSNVGKINRLFAAIINLDKPFILLANGSGVGLGMTILGLADFVIAKSNARFYGPFLKRGICPEVASTFSFSHVMGQARANRYLLFGESFTAEEGLKNGLISRIVRDDESFEKVSNDYLERLTSLPFDTMSESIKLIRSHVRSQLHQANNAECETLYQCFLLGKLRFSFS